MLHIGMNLVLLFVLDINNGLLINYSNMMTIDTSANFAVSYTKGCFLFGLGVYIGNVAQQLFTHNLTGFSTSSIAQSCGGTGYIAIGI